MSQDQAAASSHILEPPPQDDAILDQEDGSESVRVESKVFYVDLKENVRGRYLKLSEKGFNRPRSTIIVPQPGLMWFVKLFDYYLTAAGQPQNKELVVENKVFYFSVGENPRGCYLRISESGLGSTAGRSSLVIPSAGNDAAGWIHFRDSIQRVCQLEESANKLEVDEDKSVVGPGPSPPTLLTTSTGAPVLRVGQKRFFFDQGDNDKGKYLKITEIVGDDRKSLFIPFIALLKFQEALTICVAAGEEQIRDGVPAPQPQPQQQQGQHAQQQRVASSLMQAHSRPRQQSQVPGHMHGQAVQPMYRPQQMRPQVMMPGPAAPPHGRQGPPPHMAHGHAPPQHVQYMPIMPQHGQLMQPQQRVAQHPQAWVA